MSVAAAVRLTPSDPVSELVETIRLQAWVPGEFHMTAPWGFRARGRLGWFYLVNAGECSISVDSGSSVAARAGDLVLVAQGHPHRVRDPHGNCPDSLEQLLRPAHFQGRQPLVSGGGGIPTRLSCICFALNEATGNPLMEALPAMLWVRGDWGRPLPFVEHLSRMLIEEADAGLACSQVVINRLVRLLLIKVVHRHAPLPGADAGWLRAFADPGVSRALSAMHGRLDMPWTVASLADAAVMSRSVFSSRFGAMLGKPPLEYLTECRMRRAELLLRTGTAGMKEIAAQVGYDSAAAFSKAFTRWAGLTPTEFRERARPDSAGRPVPIAAEQAEPFSGLQTG